MANTFKNVKALAVGTSATTVYTVPAATVAVVLGVNFGNLAAAQIAVTLVMAGATQVQTVPIPANAGFSSLDGKIILMAGDTVVVTSDTAASVDVLVSYLEQT